MHGSRDSRADREVTWSGICQDEADRGERRSLTEQEREDQEQIEFNERWIRNRNERDALIGKIRGRIKGQPLRIRMAGWIAIAKTIWKYREIVEEEK